MGSKYTVYCPDSLLLPWYQVVTMVSGCCHGIRLLPWYQGGGHHHTLQEVVDSVSYSTGSCNLLVLFIVIATHLVVKVGRCPLVASQTQVYQSWLERGEGEREGLGGR